MTNPQCCASSVDAVIISRTRRARSSVSLLDIWITVAIHLRAHIRKCSFLLGCRVVAPRCGTELIGSGGEGPPDSIDVLGNAVSSYETSMCPLTQGGTFWSKPPAGWIFSSLFRFEA